MGIVAVERQTHDGQAGTPAAQGERSTLLIRLEKLCKTYTEAGVTRTILNELDREFYAGEFVALLGKSGSGKSTLLNLISAFPSLSSFPP